MVVFPPSCARCMLVQSRKGSGDRAPQTGLRRGFGAKRCQKRHGLAKQAEWGTTRRQVCPGFSGTGRGGSRACLGRRKLALSRSGLDVHGVCAGYDVPPAGAWLRSHRAHARVLRPIALLTAAFCSVAASLVTGRCVADLRSLTAGWMITIAGG